MCALSTTKPTQGHHSGSEQFKDSQPTRNQIPWNVA